MMMWNKIKIVAAMVCVIALVGTGSGWLARGRNAVEASLPAAEPPAKKDWLLAAAPEPANKIRNQIEEIHNRLNQLAREETDWERNEREILFDRRLELAEARDSVDFRLRGNKNELRDARKRMYMAEYELERIETRRARTREEYAVKRQALLARLEQLEGQSLGLEPTDRLRDVERKLDALRREVGELRRALERQGKEGQKKSE